MDRLNPIDAQFIDAEDKDENASMAIASIAVFEGPAPSYDDFLAALARRLPLVPLYRRKLRTVPLRLGPPVWVDDPNFDLRYHIRQTALPAPGGDEQLCNLMARVMAQRLDRDYPLWEYWLVEGLAQGRWALICKMHHCMVDGISGTDMYRVIFDTSPSPEPEPQPYGIAASSQPAASEPAALELAVQAALDAAVLPWRQGAALQTALADPLVALRQVADTVRGLVKMAGALRPAADSSLTGPIGQQRRYACARASLADVKTIRRALGGTVNDVVLAAISSAFRTLLIARGEQPEARMVPSLVPVSVRGPGEEDIYDNRMTVMLASLPVDVADPADRLAAVRAELETLKTSKEGMVGQGLVTLGRYAPFPVASLSTRIVYGLPQREIVTVTTNVPGPRRPLYGLGRRLVEIIPYVPIAATLRTGIAVFSYCGDLTFGITGDYATTPDLDVLARGIESGISELLTAAMQGSEPAPAAPGRPAARPAEAKPKRKAAAKEPPAEAKPKRKTGAKAPGAAASPTAAAKKPRATAARTHPAATAAEPAPAVTAAAPKPAVSAGKPAPAVTTPEPNPAVTTAQPTPAVTTPEPNPAVTTAQPTPAVTTPEPNPAVTTAQPTPAVTAAEPRPAKTGED